jgi:hypothetical protein
MNIFVTLCNANAEQDFIRSDARKLDVLICSVEDSGSFVLNKTKKTKKKKQ